MTGMLYVRFLEMSSKNNKYFSRNPYARIREWKLFRKRIKESKKKYDRKKIIVDNRKEM